VLLLLLALGWLLYWFWWLPLRVSPPEPLRIEFRP
jgi:hypothetical protein